MLGLLNCTRPSKDIVCDSNCQLPKVNFPAKETKQSRIHWDRYARIAVETVCFLHPILQTFPKLLPLKSCSPTYASPGSLSCYQINSTCWAFFESSLRVCRIKSKSSIPRIEIVFFALRSINKILQTQVLRASCFRAMKSIGIWGIEMNVFIRRFWSLLIRQFLLNIH